MLDVFNVATDTDNSDSPLFAPHASDAYLMTWFVLSNSYALYEECTGMQKRGETVYIKDMCFGERIVKAA